MWWQKGQRGERGGTGSGDVYRAEPKEGVRSAGVEQDAWLLAGVLLWAFPTGASGREGRVCTGLEGQCTECAGVHRCEELRSE